ncbi:histidine kinase [Rhodoferax sp. UBA5149]|uniref:histidine kinase n=1 Tax=Rhodoferax sp. UBA5149 TaxID=1947379 RepID=UPI0025E67A45|nr:histidine kinase [Rhodoferax sp. UBA5149]
MRLQIRQPNSVSVFAALTIAAIVVSVSFLLWGLRERELQHARQVTIALTQMLMEQTEQNFERADLVLLGVQERLSSAYGSQFSLDSAPTHLLLGARVSGVRQLRSLFLVDAQGMVINSSRNFPTPKQSVADRAYYKNFVQDPTKKFFIQTPVRSRLDNSWTLYMARPLFDSSGKFRGVIVAAMSIPEFELTYNKVKFDYVRPIAVYLSDGTLVGSFPHREDVIGDLAPELNNETLPAKGDAVRTIRHDGGDGASQVFALGRLVGYPLLLSVTDDENLSLASWRETAVPIAAGALLMSIFTVLVAMFLIRKLKNKEEMTFALRVANDLYQHTVNSVMDAIVAVDETMRIVLFNPAAEKMFALKANEVIGKPFEMLIPEGVRVAHRGHFDWFTGSDEGSRTMAPQLEITGRRADGKEFPIESTISKSLIGGKLQMTAVLRDVTQHRLVEVELREVNRQLRKLSASLQFVREEERTRISRELHDELGQQLTGLKLSLSWLGTRLKDGRSATPDMVDEMRYLLDTAITSVRRISTELRPLILDDLGFGEALSWQTLEFAKRSALEVTLNLQAANDVQGDELATALFRIVQESLTNVARHANATKVKIDLVLEGGKLVLTVNDDGQGIQDNAKKGGIGLVSMRERANSIGAQFNIISGPGAGTTIEVTIPINVPPLDGEVA